MQITLCPLEGQKQATKTKGNPQTLQVALSALAAVASADVVNPALTVPYAYGVHAFGGKSAPCVNGLNLPVPCAGAPLAYAGLPYAAGPFGKKKREAEADAQVILGGLGYGLGYHGVVAAAAPAVLGTPALPNPVHAVAATPAGLVHSSHVGLCTNYLGAAVPCRKKREAEADAQVIVGGLGPIGYGLGYHGVVAAPAVAAVAPAIPNPGHAVVATAAGLIHSSHVGLCTNYLGAAVPCRKKRSANPHGGYHGFPHHGYPLGFKSAPCVNGANVPVPCASALHHHHHHGHHYKKREADADAQVILGGLGYHGLLAAPHVVAAPAVAPTVVAAAPVVAPAALVHNAVLGTADLPNPVHAVAHTLFGAVHSSHIGVCTNYLGEQVPC